MNAYAYDQDGIFTGTGLCQRDPVRSAAEGRDCFLLPAMAADIAPPEFDPETQLARWDGAAWHVEEKPVPPEPEETPEPGPSALEVLRADVDYIAAMTGVIL